MTSKKTAKRALLTSVLALVMCVAMLVGTTFAWFTDSVVSGNNVIMAGNLDVELEYWNGTAWEKVTAATNVFEENTLWEPGHTEVVYLRISNLGSLALKYQLGVNVVEETAGTNVNGETFNLSDVIEFGTVEGVETPYADRETARDALESSAALSTGYSKYGEMLPNTAPVYVAMVVYMPESVGNEANYLTGTAAPKITLGIELQAAQLMSEEDTFGPDYDGGAAYVPAWDGEISEVPAEVEGVITISTPGQLAALSEAVKNGNSYSGKTVELAADLDLANNPWTPIGACEESGYFQGTFDGKGHTIYNLNVDKSADTSENTTAGLFGWVDASAATIKNVNIDGATVKGSHWVGALVGYMSGTVSNCTVTNSTVIGVEVNAGANGDKVGGLVGILNQGTLLGNTVENTTVSANRDAGGLVGSVTAGQTLMNNLVKDTTVVYITEKTYASAGAIVSGRTGFEPDATNKAENVLVTKGELVAEGVVKTGNKAYQVVSKAGLMNLAAVLEPINIWDEIPINVTLMVDVDMSGEVWTPISKMRVNFDGNGNTISNLVCTEADNKSGFFGYMGGSTVSNLTLENVTATGSQAGIFAGQVEGGKIVNCTIAGDNTVTWDDASTDATTKDGIGAFTGVSVSYGTANSISGTIAEGATVTLNKGAMTEWATTDLYYGGFFTADYETLIPVVDVTDNGKITVAVAVSTADELNSVLASHDNVAVSLAAGNYTMPSTSGNVTISGTKEAVITVSGNPSGSNVTFNGVTVKGSGFATGVNADTVTYNNVTVIGDMCLYREKVVFNTCTFELNGEYIWTYGAAEVEFNTCTFNTTGKAILIYNEGDGASKVTVKGCTFNATAGAKAGEIANQNCAAIEINNYQGTDAGVAHILITEGNTYTEGTFSGEWRIKNYQGSNPITVNGVAYTTIAIDGKTMTIDANKNVTVNG